MHFIFYRCTFLLLLLSIVSSNALAKKPTPVVKAPITMSDYIELHCKSQCVAQEELLRATYKASKAYRVDPIMLLAIVKVESGFKPLAKAGSNTGLMQVHLRWHRAKFEGDKPTEVNPNLRVGASIYAEYLNLERGNVMRALKRYNGHGDKNYVVKVQKARSEIARLVDLDRSES
jgi:soluble lytic murein transglycosylase-like protein